MYRGVITHAFDSEHIENAQINQISIDELLGTGEVEEGDLVIITKGDYTKAHGGTNTLKVVRVGNDLR